MFRMMIQIDTPRYTLPPTISASTTPLSRLILPSRHHEQISLDGTYFADTYYEKAPYGSFDQILKEPDNIIVRSVEYGI